MDKAALKQLWLAEQRAARIHGWDFSHLEGRYETGRLPWDYREAVEAYRRPELRLLDLDTGGGEFLLSLGHPAQNTSATENYPPNAALCRQVLTPRGIDFRPADAAGPLPFPDGQFDLVLNRHGRFDPAELARVLKPGGVFVTQQVGAENDRELAELLLPGRELPFPQQTLDRAAKRLAENGFELLQGQEAFGPIRFYDVGALVWFARVLPWEFPGFSVERCLPALYEAQRMVEANGCVEGRIHRFLLAARKRKGGENQSTASLTV